MGSTVGLIELELVSSKVVEVVVERMKVLDLLVAAQKAGRSNVLQVEAVPRQEVELYLSIVVVVEMFPCLEGLEGQG